MSEMRLQKFLAEAGVASRRKAEELIKSGRVKVNGEVACQMGIKVRENDNIVLDDKPVFIEKKKVYIMLNKPTGYVTTSKDQFSRPTVIDLLKKDIDIRVFPVGRLDYDTSGLLLLSNDGNFTYTLTHPKHEKQKVYIADVNGIPTTKDLQHFERGLEIEDYVTSPAKVKVLQKGNSTSVLKITIHEGKNRQVRKMCEAIGCPVIRLKRIAIGTLKLGDLPEGKWRHLTEEEIKVLVE